MKKRENERIPDKMVMCSRCKKRAAVVFITRMDGNEAKNEGLCLKCAKELKLPNVENIMKQLGINEEDLDEISDQVDEVFSERGDENFTPGGAPSMEMFNNLMNKFGAIQNGERASSDEPR